MIYKNVKLFNLFITIIILITFSLVIFSFISTSILALTQSSTQVSSFQTQKSKLSNDLIKTINDSITSYYYNNTQYPIIITLNSNNQGIKQQIITYLNQISKSKPKELPLINAVAIKLNPNQLYNFLQRYDNYINKVYLDKKVKAFTSSSQTFPSYGDVLIGVGTLDKKYNNKINGSGIKIGVIDTGIAYNNSYLGGCDLSQVLSHNPKCAVWGGADFTSGTKSIIIATATKTLFDNNEPFYLSNETKSSISFTLPKNRNIYNSSFKFSSNFTLQNNINYALNISSFNETESLFSTHTDINFTKSVNITTNQNNSPVTIIINKPSHFILTNIILNLTIINKSEKVPNDNPTDLMNNYTVYLNNKEILPLSFVCSDNVTPITLNSTNQTNQTNTTIYFASIHCYILHNIPTSDKNYSENSFNLTIVPLRVTHNETLTAKISINARYNQSFNITNFVKKINHEFNNSAYYTSNQIKLNYLISKVDSHESSNIINNQTIAFTNLQLAYSYQKYNFSKDIVDDCGHGTHVAGIIHSVAPEAKLYSYRVLGFEGDAYTSTIIQAVEQAIKDKVNIISMSLGTPYSETSGICDDNPLSQSLIDAYNSGIDVVIAAGNDYCKKGVSVPACSSGALSVGAIYENKTLTDFSNSGPNLDVVAPGYEINSTVPTYSTLDNMSIYLHSASGWMKLSGTSMATPFVSGSIALLLQAYNNSYGYIPSSSYVYSVVRRSATDLGDYGKDNTYGYGMINVTSLVGFGLNLPQLTPNVNQIYLTSYNNSNYTFYLIPSRNSTFDFNFTVSWTNLTNYLNEEIPMKINNHTESFNASISKNMYPLTITITNPMLLHKTYFFAHITIYVTQTNQTIEIPVKFNNLDKSEYNLTKEIRGFIDVRQNLIFPIYVPSYVFSITYNLTWSDPNATSLGLELYDSKGNPITLMRTLSTQLSLLNLINHNKINEFMNIIKPLISKNSRNHNLNPLITNTNNIVSTHNKIKEINLLPFVKKLRNSTKPSHKDTYQVGLITN